jgi:hypothetical protein
MASQRQPRIRVDADGVRAIRTPTVRAEVWLVVAALVVAGVVLFLWRSKPIDAPREQQEMAARANEERGAAVARAERANRLPATARDLPPRTDGEVAGEMPEGYVESAPALEGLEQGQPTGIALFPPPGTDPLKRGIVVPEDFELPPGFMRHYQVTDDGKPLQAILMFHPDYQPVDENGEPISLPEDRVVPPEMAPPGLAIEVLEDPEAEAAAVEEDDGAER